MNDKFSKDEFKDEIDPSPQQESLNKYIKKLEQENQNLKAQIGTDERLFEYVRKEITRLPPLDPIYVYRQSHSRKKEVWASLIVSDTHSEEYVSSEEMEGLAYYDWNTFHSRMETTAKKTVSIVNSMRKTHNIMNLDIWSLGDWFCGKIQPQEESYGVTMPMPVAVPKVGREFANLVRALSPHFNQIRVHGKCGNHGREGKKTVFKMTADRNWDMSVYLIARDYTEDLPNVEWQIPKSIMSTTDIMGNTCLLTHSGEVNMTNRVPYYPIENTFDLEYKIRPFNYVFTGHYHHHALLASYIVLCPSMIGPSQFSRFKLHRVANPEQLLCFFDEKYGLLSQWPIKL